MQIPEATEENNESYRLPPWRGYNLEEVSRRKQ